MPLSPAGPRLFAIALALSVNVQCASGPQDPATAPTSEQRQDRQPAGRAHELDTDIEPDPAATGDQAPLPADLARYVEDIEGDGPLQAVIETSQGPIECRLFPEKAPITVTNFVGLARGLKAFVDHELGAPITGVPYYDGVEFHRVIPGFMIQTGDRSNEGHGHPGYRIPDEFSDHLRHDQPGVLSMANRGPNTGGSQFFITEQPAPHLDDRHTIFGQCDSLPIIRAISHAPTEDLNRPVEPRPRIETIRFHRD